MNAAGLLLHAGDADAESSATANPHRRPTANDIEAAFDAATLQQEIELPEFSLDDLTWLYESPVTTGPLPPWEAFPTELPLPCKPLGQVVRVRDSWQPMPQLGVCQKPGQGWLGSQQQQQQQPQPPQQPPQQQRQEGPASNLTEAHQRTALLLRYWQLTHQLEECSGSSPHSPCADGAAAHTHHYPRSSGSGTGVAEHRQPCAPTLQQALLLAGEGTGSIGLTSPTHKRTWEAVQPAAEATAQAQAQAQWQAQQAQQGQLAEGGWFSPRSPAGTALGVSTHPSMHFESALERPRLVVPCASLAAHPAASASMQAAKRARMAGVQVASGEACTAIHLEQPDYCRHELEQQITALRRELRDMHLMLRRWAIKGYVPEDEALDFLAHSTL